MTKDVVGSNSFEQFNTAKFYEAGQKMTIIDPFTGQDTEHWILVASRMSRAYNKSFYKAITKNNRELQMRGSSEEVDTSDAVTAGLCASIKGWSFEEPCTQENIAKFLEVAMDVKEQLLLFIAVRENFFPKKT